MNTYYLMTLRRILILSKQRTNVERNINYNNKERIYNGSNDNYIKYNISNTN